MLCDNLERWDGMGGGREVQGEAGWGAGCGEWESRKQRSFSQITPRFPDAYVWITEHSIKRRPWDFPDGPMVKNMPCAVQGRQV